MEPLEIFYGTKIHPTLSQVYFSGMYFFHYILKTSPLSGMYPFLLGTYP